MRSGFTYPDSPHRRRHGPLGYADYDSDRPWLRDEFDFRCIFCLIREQWGRVSGEFNVEHYVPALHLPGHHLPAESLHLPAIHLSASPLAAPPPEVYRHRAAIRRSELSLPVKCLLRDGLLDPADRLFDDGCHYNVGKEIGRSIYVDRQREQLSHPSPSIPEPRRSSISWPCPHP